MAPEWEHDPRWGEFLRGRRPRSRKHLAPDAAVTSDAGNFCTFIHRHIGFRPGQMFLASVVGAMGAGVPMAVAAALRRPGTQVVAFAGDGGALMTGNEIATAMQYGVNPILIISDNKRYGTISMHHDMRYPGRPSRPRPSCTNPDFALGPQPSAPRASPSARSRGRGRHRAGLRGEGPAGGGACPYLDRADQRMAAAERTGALKIRLPGITGLARAPRSRHRGKQDHAPAHQAAPAARASHCPIGIVFSISTKMARPEIQ